MPARAAHGADIDPGLCRTGETIYQLATLDMNQQTKQPGTVVVLLLYEVSRSFRWGGFLVSPLYSESV